MSEEKKNIETEEVKEARQLSEEELAKVGGGVGRGLVAHFAEIKSELEIE